MATTKDSSRNQEPDFYKNPKNFKLIFIFLIFILSFILFGSSIEGKFVGDDRHVVAERVELRSLKNVPHFFVLPAFPGQAWIRIYRPFTLTSYALNFSISDKPAGFHILNIILHALNVLLIFLIVQVFASKRVAIVSSLLFMFLPIHTEAVSSIVGRSELLSIFFILLSLLLFFRNRHAWASLAFLGALFSKDFSIAFLPLVGLLLLIETKSLKKSFKTGLYYLAPLPIYFLLRYFALGKYAFSKFEFDLSTAPLAFLPLKERIFTGFLDLALYFRKTFYPIDLSPDYSYNQIQAVYNIFSSPGAIIGVIIFLGFIALILFGNRTLKIAASILLVPFILISNMFIVTSGSFAERWWYLPSFGLMVIVAVGIDWLVKKWEKLKIPALIFLTAVLGWFAILIWKQNEVWLTDKNLYFRAAEISPNSTWARSNVASIYITERKFDKARQEIKVSLDIYPKYAPAWHLLGLIEWYEKNLKSAEEDFKKALQFDLPGRNTRGIYRNLAFLNFDFGNVEQALLYMKKVEESPPTRGDEREIEVDRMLYQIIERYKGRKFSSYTDEEKKKLGTLVRQIRGF